MWPRASFLARADGGPTSWQAIIDPPAIDDDYREFLLEFADCQLAYTAESTGFPDPVHVINPPARDEIGIPDLLQKAAVCPGGALLPCPELISSTDDGTMSVNYRNEPLALRMRNPATNTQAGDLAQAFSSTVVRSDGAFNVQPTFYAPLTGDVQDQDPTRPCCALRRTTGCRSASSSAPTRRVTISASTASSGCSSRPIPTLAGAPAR